MGEIRKGNEEGQVLGYIGPRGFIDHPINIGFNTSLSEEEVQNTFAKGAEILESLTPIDLRDESFREAVAMQTDQYGLESKSLEELHELVAGSSHKDWQKEDIYFTAVAKQIQKRAESYLLQQSQPKE